MDVGYSQAETIIAQVLRDARVSRDPNDRIQIGVQLAQRLSPRIFKRLKEADFIAVDADQEQDARECIRSAFLRAREHDLPTDGTQKTEAALVGQIYSALYTSGYLLRAE